MQTNIVTNSIPTYLQCVYDVKNPFSGAFYAESQNNDHLWKLTISQKSQN